MVEGEIHYKESQMVFKHIKGPLIFTSTALIFAAPVCLAEAANAQTTYADDSFRRVQPGFQQPQKQSALVSRLQGHSFLGQTPQTIRSFKSPIYLADITLDDVILLQSRLTAAESQLRTLKNTQPRNPALKPQIDELIRQAETQVLNLSNALQTADSLYKKYLTAAQKADQAATALQTAAEQEAAALEQFNIAKTAYENAQEVLRLTNQSHTEQLATLSAKLENQSQAATNKAYAFEVLQTATLNLEQKTAAHTTIQGRYDQALQAKNQAQTAYDTNLIPDPEWTVPTHEVAYTRQVAHTRQTPVYTQVPHTRQVATITQVPHTTTTVTGGLTASVYNRNGYNNAPPMPTATETPISTQNVTQVDFQWGGGSVLNSGRSEDVIVKFTGYISVQTSNYYHFYAPADDGTRLYINNQLLIDDWYDKGGGGSTSQAVYLTAGQAVPITLYYYENGGGAAVSLQYYTYDAPYYQIAPAAWFGTQTQTSTYYTEETTYTTETYYTTEVSYVTETYYTPETYYVTEPITSVQKTLQVDIREGGQATFTAPAGSTFVSSNLRYEAIDRPNCGANIYPQVNGLQSVTLQANNSVYGDPCGGWVKHITGTLTYLGAPTAPLIKNPELLVVLNDAEAELEAANNALTTAASEVSTAQTQKQSATTQYQSTLSEYETASEAVSLAQLGVTSAEQEQTTASAQVATAQSTYQAADTTYQAAQTQTLTATSAKQDAEAKTAAVSTSYQRSVVRAKEIPAPTETFAQVEELQTKEPEPEALPEEITAESVLEIDLSKVDPTQMTEAQAEELVAAALVIFETAEEGSAEYEQALDALYLAAEQDDIVLDPALAVIPGLQAATELVNFLGNAGADMSPKKREESKKVVVSAVVAAGTAIQSAAAAASTSAASSSGSRRTGK